MTQRPSLTRLLVQLWDPALSALEDVHKAQRGCLTDFRSARPLHTETVTRGFTSSGTVATQFKATYGSG